MVLATLCSLDLGIKLVGIEENSYLAPRKVFIVVFFSFKGSIELLSGAEVAKRLASLAAAGLIVTKEKNRKIQEKIDASCI